MEIFSLQPFNTAAITRLTQALTDIERANTESRECRIL